MAELIAIIGAGFSKPAGLPLANEINNFLTRDNAETILNFSSAEFMWIDFANDTYKHNGRLGYDHLAYGIMLNEFVKQHIAENGGFGNYEDFYQYVIDNLDKEDVVEVIKSKSLLSFDLHFPHIKDGQFYKNYTHAIHHFQQRVFKSMVIHLIGDLLFVRSQIEEVKLLYKEFIDFCEKYDTIDFITLNHDLLLERLIKDLLTQEYSDGFTKDQKILKSLGGEPLNLFQGKFSKNINLIKLHGSIDTYRFIVAKQEGSILTPTGESLFFKTHDFYEKQSAERYDPETGEKVQTFHWDIDPQFVTGTRKKEILALPGMYKSLYEETETRIMHCSSILIIGYSFGDEHVNEIIQQANSKSKRLTKIINVNPSRDFPYEVKKTVLHQFKDVSELNYRDKYTILSKIKEDMLLVFYKIWRYISWQVQNLLKPH